MVRVADGGGEEEEEEKDEEEHGAAHDIETHTRAHAHKQSSLAHTMHVRQNAIRRDARVG
jgi:hypothetical protein